MENNSRLQEIVLLDSEEILFEIEGNAYTTSPHPVIKLIMSIVRIIGIIVGWSLKTKIVVTNRRVIRIDREKILWVITRNIKATTLTKSSIREVGYQQVRVWLLFRTLYFTLQSYTEETMIAYKGSLKEVNDMVSKVSNLVTV